MREDKLLEILNEMIKVLDPIKFEDLNATWVAVNQDGLYALEKEYNEVGIKLVDGKATSSVAALIATITDVLVGKRLAFQIDDEGFIIGFQWYEAPSKS